MSLGVEADERQAQPVPQRRGLPMEISRLLFGSILSAITVTVAVVAVLISEGSRPAPAGGWLAAVLLVITVNLAVLGWTTVVWTKCPRRCATCWPCCVVTSTTT
jgi:hypothetical protein